MNSGEHERRVIETPFVDVVNRLSGVGGVCFTWDRGSGSCDIVQCENKRKLWDPNPCRNSAAR